MRITTDKLMSMKTSELKSLKYDIDKEIDRREGYLKERASNTSLFNRMTALIFMVEEGVCDWHEIWDEFWRLDKELSKYWKVEYYDPDTSYEEDIMARYNSYKEYYENGGEV